ncbi:unnamed protein product [Prorocentrum cordatum]|uniref:Uncharacterized protein n=1 Tax=Prorocentrum cordatum TaxID=2364126 RepID=A0ABN9Y2D1_9DINO|nr:unnamed protein product [Polarella glacialis]
MVREVLAGVAAARWAADSLVRRLDRELREAREVIASLQAQLECGSRGDAAEAEALRREAIARPALVARVRGRRETMAQWQRRDVAWHAERCPSADAPPQEWRGAQRGPRLPGGPLPGDGRGGAAQSAIACEVETCVCEVQPPIECALDACVAEAPTRLPSARAAAARAPLRSGARPYHPEWARWAALLEELGVAQLAEQGCGEGGAESTVAEEIIAEFGCEAEEDRAAAARCSAWRPRRSGGSLEGGSEFEGDSEFEDLGSEHGQFLRDYFSGGSDLAAEYELARAAWLERSGSRRDGGGGPEEERGALALAAVGSEVGPGELHESDGSNAVPAPCGLHGGRRAGEPSEADPVGLGQECERSKRVSFAPWPDVVDLEAVDLMHLCECERFGISVRPRRRPAWRVRFAEGPWLVQARPPGMSVGRALELELLIRACKPSGVAALDEGSKHRAMETPRPPSVAVVEAPVGGAAIERAVGVEPPLFADSVDCAAGDGRSSSEGVFVSFLDDFSAAAVACAAKGPKSGVGSLLDLAEARALGVRLGSAGCPDAEERQRLLDGLLVRERCATRPKSEG